MGIELRDTTSAQRSLQPLRQRVREIRIAGVETFLDEVPRDSPHVLASKSGRKVAAIDRRDDALGRGKQTGRAI
jgi:hypothetical protein